MSKRPPGRPKAAQPKDIRVTVRLSACEADLLQRLAGDRSLSDAIRMCIKTRIDLYGGATRLPDSEKAMIRRALQHIRKPESPEAAQLRQLFGLDEPSLDAMSPQKPSPAPLPPVNLEAYEAYKDINNKLASEGEPPSSRCLEYAVRY
jgi:hypothetical protein